MGDRPKLTREGRIQALHDLIERQMEGRKKLERELAELDEATREALGEYMDLVSPRAAPGSKGGDAEGVDNE